MRNDLIVSRSIDIKAGPSTVWRALTDPSIIKEYLYGTETITDWKVGSEIIFQGEYQGQTYRDKGIVQENVTNEILSYLYWSGFSGLPDKPENYSRVTYELQPLEPGLTRFTWTTKGFASEESFQHSDAGMNDLLEKMKEIIERKARFPKYFY
jgi:uncharacterized protein YndB with AHSA1/START domain